MAIFRGVTPDEILPIAESLYNIGWRTLEVPLNSPEPYKSLSLLVKHFGADCTIGAGTVLTTEQVKQVADTGASLIVSPCTNADVIRATKQLGLFMMAGVLTPTECFNALGYGADSLKIFPSESIQPSYIKALRAVLPKESVLYLTGGIKPDNMQDFITAGANGFGIGGALYQIGKSIEQITRDGRIFMEHFNKCGL